MTFSQIQVTFNLPKNLVILPKNLVILPKNLMTKKKKGHQSSVNPPFLNCQTSCKPSSFVHLPSFSFISPSFPLHFPSFSFIFLHFPSSFAIPQRFIFKVPSKSIFKVPSPKMWRLPRVGARVHFIHPCKPV